MAGSVLFAYAYVVFVNQQEISLSMNGILTKLTGESMFALMSLLGASVLPQNFYLHSALVQVFIPLGTFHFHNIATVCLIHKVLESQTNIRLKGKFLSHD